MARKFDLSLEMVVRAILFGILKMMAVSAATKHNYKYSTLLYINFHDTVVTTDIMPICGDF
jgi:hypothetical protein